MTLLLLATTSVIGTVILQNGTPQQYIAKYGKPIYSLLWAFDITDMYHAWWFLLLIILICVNIVVCSIERLSLTWKIIFPKTISFNPARYQKLKNLQSFSLDQNKEKIVEKYKSFLFKKIGKVLVDANGTSTFLCAEKGRWTRLGVYVVHFSILLLLIGALIGSVFGFKGNLKLNEGETSNQVRLDKLNTMFQLPFSIRCDAFAVKFYDSGAPEEFKSTLTVIENQKQSFTKNILVNHPLRYKGINVFQASYGTASPNKATFEIYSKANDKIYTYTLGVGETIQLPDEKAGFTFEGFLPHYDFRGHNLGESFFAKITPEGQKGFQIVLPTQYPTFDKMRKGKLIVEVKDFKQKYYTGLQVTKDPGIWYVYSGFIFLILGCWITFFMSHHSVFIEISNSGENLCEIKISGKTNRNTHGMKMKIKRFVTQLKEL